MHKMKNIILALCLGAVVLAGTAAGEEQAAYDPASLLKEVDDLLMESNGNNGRVERDPFSMKLPAILKKEGNAGIEPERLSDVLDLSRISVKGLMRMADGSRMAILWIKPIGLVLVRKNQPILIGDLYGKNMVCLVKDIRDDVISLELADGEEVTFPVVSAPAKGKPKALSRIKGKI